jgi:hypothetical protein
MSISPGVGADFIRSNVQISLWRDRPSPSQQLPAGWVSSPSLVGLDGNPNLHPGIKLLHQHDTFRFYMPILAAPGSPLALILTVLPSKLHLPTQLRLLRHAFSLILHPKLRHAQVNMALLTAYEPSQDVLAAIPRSGPPPWRKSLQLHTGPPARPRNHPEILRHVHDFSLTYPARHSP